jgi:hypothetical protein
MKQRPCGLESRKILGFEVEARKLTIVTNSEFGDHFLAYIIIILSFLFKNNLNDMLLMTCLYSFSLFEIGGEALCHYFFAAKDARG